MAIAWVFPGQGSQKVGMAEALLSIEGSRERFAMASELLGRDLLAICQGESGGGDGLDDLNDTRNCLLYTSPSPRDYAASRMPSSA